MTNEFRKRLFLWLFVLDSVLAVAIVLAVQSVTVGFDPIFYHPVLIAATSIVSMAIGSYLPFFIFYKLVFEALVKRTQVGATALCWMLFAGLNVVIIGVAIVSYAGAITFIDVALPVGIGAINVAIFFRLRVRALSVSSAIKRSTSAQHESEGGGDSLSGDA